MAPAPRLPGSCRWSPAFSGGASGDSCHSAPGPAEAPPPRALHPRSRPSASASVPSQPPNGRGCPGFAHVLHRHRLQAPRGPHAHRAPRAEASEKGHFLKEERDDEQESTLTYARTHTHTRGAWVGLGAHTREDPGEACNKREHALVLRGRGRRGDEQGKAERLVGSATLPGGRGWAAPETVVQAEAGRPREPGAPGRDGGQRGVWASGRRRKACGCHGSRRGGGHTAGGREDAAEWRRPRRPGEGAGLSGRRASRRLSS